MNAKPGTTANDELGSLVKEQAQDDTASTTGATGRHRIGRERVTHDDVDHGASLWPARSTEQAALSVAFEPLIDLLPAKQQEVIRALYFAGKTEAEAAYDLGISRGALRVHRDRALARLREQISQRISPMEEAS